MSILTELQSISGHKMVTYYGLCNQGDFDMNGSYPTTISMRTLKTILKNKPLAIIVRQFTDIIDEKSNIPWKNIYGYCIKLNGTWIRMPADENRECNQYNGQVEQFVNYL
jgi:hypothetical protein